MENNNILELPEITEEPETARQKSAVSSSVPAVANTSIIRRPPAQVKSVDTPPLDELNADDLRKSVGLYATLLPRDKALEFGAVILNAPYKNLRFRIGLKKSVSPEMKRRIALYLGLTTTSTTVIQFQLVGDELFADLFEKAYESGNLMRSQKRVEQKQTRNTRFWDGDKGEKRKVILNGYVVDDNSEMEDARNKRLDISDLNLYYEIMRKLDAGEYKESDLKTVRFATLILQDFVLSGASDMHFDPRRGGGSIRYRFQKKLYTRYENIPTAIFLRIVSFFCLLGGDDPTKMNKRGIASMVKLIITYGGERKPVEFRFQSSPTIQGVPCLVLRGHVNPLKDINKIGFLPVQLSDVHDAISNDRGLVIVTGPTGSGKTNTLNCIFTILEKLNDLKIYEVGTPIEIESAHRQQITIPQFDDEKMNDLARQRTFEIAMRQDPDVLGYTETRNSDEMKKCFRGATSGHLVLTTLHAADVEEAFVTLFGMGIDRDIISKGVQAIISQTLIPTLCQSCRIFDAEATALTNNEHRIYREDEAGCEECRNGFGGVTVVAEVLRFNDDVRRWVREGMSPGEIVKAATAENTKYLMPMKHVAREKVNAGITSESAVVNLIELRTTLNVDSELNVSSERNGDFDTDDFTAAADAEPGEREPERESEVIIDAEYEMTE